VDGACIGSEAVDCPPLDECHADGVCLSATGRCTSPMRPDGAPCADQTYCTTADTCRAGVCTAGVARDCDDDDDCTADLCDDEIDACVHNVVSPCCGNGLDDAGETCDQGALNSEEANVPCRTDCRPRRCGDGIVDDRFGEMCDRGPSLSNDPGHPCRTDCLPRRCGDGIVDGDAREQCDDGNTTPNDGCSPRCFLEPPPGSPTLPGDGNEKTECVIAWRVTGVRSARTGKAALRVSPCRDGDPDCDHDGAADGTCRFHVWLCANNSGQPGQPCSPGVGRDGVGTLSIAEVRAPTTREAAQRPADDHNRAEIEIAAAAAPVGHNLDVCGPRLDIHVPLAGRRRRGAARLKIRGTTNRNVHDVEALKLVCLPASGARAAAAAPEGSDPPPTP
jgi:cysteine-rich repeat protein